MQQQSVVKKANPQSLFSCDLYLVLIKDIQAPVTSGGILIDAQGVY